MTRLTENVLQSIETQNLDGITSADLLAFFATHNIRFGEATLRKWVQLGLLPRSVRVGKKGKHQGSKGKYPVRVIRQILRIKELMMQNLTIEQIQRRFLFVRGDIESLEQTLGEIFITLERVVGERGDRLASVRAHGTELTRARSIAHDLLKRLEGIEGRLVDSPSRQAPAESAAS